MNKLRAVLLVHITHHSSCLKICRVSEYFPTCAKIHVWKRGLLWIYQTFCLHRRKGNFFFYFKLTKNYFCDNNEDSDLFPATDKTEDSLIIVETWAVKSLCDENSSKDL